MSSINVIGAGLAGCEAAWQAARRGVAVRLFEMKPDKKTPAHSSDSFAELVCSNSLRSNELSNAVGLLKQELRMLGSLIMQAADATRVPAGGALAVDRVGFSEYITEKISSEPLIEVIRGEVCEIPCDLPTIIATGPLTSDLLAKKISEFLGCDSLSFYDAAAPIVSFESVDMESAYFASRYDKGTPDYINCPMSAEQYNAFYERLISAEQAQVHGFEDKKVFEGCMPVEVMARRGHDTLLFGPLKPVGLPDPKTGAEPYAVVQLRKDNSAGTLYNLVGFQTHLKFSEQKSVFSMIPALKNAEFVRYGVMHRNTYIDSPRLLNADYSLRTNCNIAFAGQMTGVEGYIESTASGYAAGKFMSERVLGISASPFPPETAIGALGRYISDSSVTKFQPMNINFGIIAPLTERVRGKKNKNEKISDRALLILKDLLRGNEN